jgi:hypothetical protein
MMLQLDLAFPRCFNRFFLPIHCAVVLRANLSNPLDVATIVCTLCHEFGGLNFPDFPADASLLEIFYMVLMLESGHAVDPANSMQALQLALGAPGLAPIKAGNYDL